MIADQELPAILGAFPLSEEQCRAALTRHCDITVTAGAGTGKTRTLVARYLSLLEEGIPLRQIVALTFTRKAAREMRNRVREEIDNFLSAGSLTHDEIERWQGIYNGLDAARTGTIHNLCADILRTHPAEAAIDPQFVVLDETQSALLAQEAVELTLAWVVNEAAFAPLFDLLNESAMVQLLAVFIEKRIAVSTVEQAIGPTTVFSHWQQLFQDFQVTQIEQLLLDPQFKAAQEVIEASRASTSEDKAELQRLAAVSALNGLRDPSLPNKRQLLKIIDGINLAGGSKKNWPGGAEELQAVKGALGVLRQSVRERKVILLDLNEQDEALAQAMPAIFSAARYVMEVYETLKREKEGLDFDDLEALAIKLLEAHQPVREYWQRQVAALLVDEFQDTNEQQRRFLRLLCPGGDRLFIVGDGKQSIYRFRGADVAVFAAEKDVIKAQGGQLIDLDVSYRAHEALLDGMNRLLQPVLGDDWPGRPAWAAPFAPLRAGTNNVRHDLYPPFVEFQAALGNKDAALPLAASAAAERLALLHEQNGIDFGDMAVLCRASNAFHYYEDAFDRAGIPYLTVAGKGFYDRPEIRDLLNALGAIADPQDDLALLGLLRSPACGLSDVSLYYLAKMREGDQSLWESLSLNGYLEDEAENDRLRKAVALIADLHQQAGRLPVASILTQFLERTYYRAILRRAGEVRALRNVSKLLVDIHDSQLVSIAGLLDYVQLLRDSGSREGEARAMSGGAVQIMSIHAAKGLEFPVVVLGDAGSEPRFSSGIIIDPELGILLPLKNENDMRAGSYELAAAKVKEQDAAERDRLLYVALTRAKQMLIINGHTRRNRSGKMSWKGWLGELAEITGLNDVDLADYDEMGAARHEFQLMLEGTAVRAVIYEPNCDFQIHIVSSESKVVNSH